jgi:hypothetical protein
MAAQAAFLGRFIGMPSDEDPLCMGEVDASVDHDGGDRRNQTRADRWCAVV